LQVAAGVRLAGIRRSFEFTPNGFATSAEVVAGVRAVGECGLPFDLVLFAERLPEVTELVRRCPGVSFVLDHLGKPSIRDGRLDPWRTDFAALARFPNVVCKVSGLVTEASPDGWTAESLRPYVSHAVDCFGWTRLMFGSDWPVCELAGGYRRWLDTVMELTSDASDVDRESFFGANAARTYAGVIAG
jgi:L-fuconolactonase